MGEGAAEGVVLREDRVFHPPDVVAGEAYGFREREAEEWEYGLRAEEEEGPEDGREDEVVVVLRLGEEGRVSTSNESEESSPKSRSASSSKSSITQDPRGGVCVWGGEKLSNLQPWEEEEGGG